MNSSHNIVWNEHDMKNTPFQNTDAILEEKKKNLLFLFFLTIQAICHSSYQGPGEDPCPARSQRKYPDPPEVNSLILLHQKFESV